MQDADDFDKNVTHYLTVRGHNAANYRGDFSSNPSVPGGGYIAGDIVLDDGHLYFSNEGMFDTPNTDSLTDSKWTQLNPGLQFFTETRPNSDPISQWNAVGLPSNLALALNPKGTGALTTAGGNLRGQFAVDWQLSRTANTQVASGDFSTIGGGQDNMADGNSSTVSGGGGNSAAGQDSTVGGGTANQANGFRSTVGGGRSNTAQMTADNATIGGGIDNIAGAVSSTVSGGQGNIANGSYSFCVGHGCTASAEASAAVGQYNQTGQIGGSERIFMVGNGSSGMPGNAFSVTADGIAHADNSFDSPGADFAEWMESSLKQKISAGTSVLVDTASGKIRPAKKGEIPFGIITTSPSLIGNSAETEWVGKYLRSSDGSIVMETYQDTREVPKTATPTVKSTKLVKKTDSKGTYYTEELVETTVEEPLYQSIPVMSDGKVVKSIQEPVTTTVIFQRTRRKINPQFDPQRQYIPRSQRPEWNLVGMLGQVLVLKDQPVNPHWRKIKSFNSDRDLYLILPSL